MGCHKSSANREIHSNTGLSQIDNLTHHLNELEKEQTKPKVSRRKEIIKVKEEINKIEIQKIIEEINKTKRWFFEKVNKIDKPLTRLTKKRRERTQINKIINEKGKITMDTAEIQKKKTMREYYEQLYQQISQSGRNGQLSRDLHLSKSEARENKLTEHSDH